MQPQEIQPGGGSDPATVNRIARLVKDRDVHPAEVELVATRPDNRADASRLQVQRQKRFRRCYTIGRIFTSCSVRCYLHAGLRDVLVNPLHDLGREGICLGQVLLQVWGQEQLLARSLLHMPEQNYPSPGKVTQVDVVPSLIA